MDHAKHYWALISRARNRSLPKCYFEKHHILPRCMGGGNEPANIAALKPEEHFVAHLLLAKMRPDNEKLAYAVSNMRQRASARHAGSPNRRYGREMRRIWRIARSNWRRLPHRIRHRAQKKRYSPASLEWMQKILSPRQVST